MENFFSAEFSQMKIGQTDELFHGIQKTFQELPITGTLHEVTRGLRVAIIGAGATGLAVLRSFALSPIQHDITVFERSDRVGGLWNYDGETGPMYRNLKTNFAKQGMAFPDFPFSEEQEDSYVTHREVAEYLRAYAESVDGYKCIKFRTRVVNVLPLKDEKFNWRIIFKSLKQEDAEEEVAEFDAVFVCNGHYDVPNMPTIPGLKHYPGKIMHSKEYDIPEKFAGMTVVILGGANSGQDIAADVASAAEKVIISHNNQLIPSQLFPNMSQCRGIVSCDERGFQLMDGSILPHPDVLICATGYRFSYSFLDSSCGIISDGVGNIQPLYKHFVNAAHPTMFLIGICQNVASFPMYYYQSQAALAILEKRYPLPDQSEMFSDIQTDFEKKMEIFKRPKYAHVMTNEQWTYNNELAKIAGCSPMKHYIPEVFYICAYMRRNHLTYYRRYQFDVEGERVSIKPQGNAPEIDEEDLLNDMPTELLGKVEERLAPEADSDAAAFFSSSSIEESDETSSGNQSSDDSCSSESEFMGLQTAKGFQRQRVPSSCKQDQSYVERA